MKRPGKALLRGLLGLSLLGLVVALTDPARVAAQLRQAQPGWLLVGLLAAMASNIVSALRWRALARWLGAEVGWLDACRWYFQAMGLNALLPGAVVGGDLYRAMALRRTGQDTAAAGWSVVLDRVSGLWMLCAMGGFGAAACADVLAPWLRLPAGAFAMLMVAGTLLWLALPWALPLLLRWSPARLQGGWLVPLREAVERPDFRRQWMGQALASAAVQVLSAAALAAGGMALGVVLPALGWAWAMAPVFLMAALPLSVGGWGTREAAAVAALAPFGVAAPAAVGVGMIYGLYGLAQGALGALALGLPRGAPR
ncbi:lysylphosphatidylglycerol synthase transmembrane domain-containing protein [Acidovorax carolinensis]|uniref:lysylphosphatidylglycerol synthase transmembrane domain-containing protein n=1 Tax=Acidovorax carolinensis TaxID=553814 RepID=UPI000B346D4C|nr:lysylphosphatidylglycerol synthase transmembrane domain-containing protein [Acidovorax carolinensis]ART46996.1 TIGR00374 family protein [Acidovorax carolinensis]